LIAVADVVRNRSQGLSKREPGADQRDEERQNTDREVPARSSAANESDGNDRRHGNALVELGQESESRKHTAADRKGLGCTGALLRRAREAERHDSKRNRIEDVDHARGRHYEHGEQRQHGSGQQPNAWTKRAQKHRDQGHMDDCRADDSERDRPAGHRYWMQHGT